MYFNWISTVSFITLNKRGIKTCFNCIISNAKLTQHPFIKSFCFSAWTNKPSENKLRSLH